MLNRRGDGSLVANVRMMVKKNIRIVYLGYKAFKTCGNETETEKTLMCICVLNVKSGKAKRKKKCKEVTKS